MNHQRLRTAAIMALLAANALFSQTHAQQQATRIQFLTKVPANSRRIAPVDQYPNKGKLIIAENVQIKPPYAWNRDDKYVAPDFEGFFPDDPAGGEQLDALFTGRLGGNHAPEDVLAAVRRGLRHTKVYKSQLLAQVGSFVWNAKQQDPRAIELLYHASDVRGPVSHTGMYYGLTVLKDRTPNVMRAISEGFSDYGGEIQYRIPWGFKTYGDNETTVDLLADLLSKPDELSDNAVIAALDLYSQAAGETYPRVEEVASRGRFVVGFTRDGMRTESEFRNYLDASVGKDAVVGFVVRIANGQAVGVGLLKGIGSREKFRVQAESDPKATLEFAETFTPNVLRWRQLREFASFLPNGLPAGARPNYAPVPENEVFAWNATDGYQPPNFADYFPDDEAGGKGLDDLYDQRETTELTARQQLTVIRNGLRRTKHGPRLSRWINSIAGWPADPMATEIMYHAADPRAPKELRYYAIYFGLSGRAKNSPNVLRLFADIILTEKDDRNFGSQTVGRVVWSIRSEEDKATVARYLNNALADHEKYSPKKLGQVTKVYEGLTGKKPATYDQYSSRGSYFVGFTHRRLKSSSDLTNFCDATFAEKPYFEKLVVGTKGSIQGMALVFVRGPKGLEQCVEDLKAIDAVSLQVGGPASLLKGSKDWQAALRGTAEPTPDEFAQAFRELYETLGEEYAHFAVKEIDWQAIGLEFQPRVEKLRSRAEFCLLCQELVARLEDSHAYLFKGTVEPESPKVPLWDPGFACLFDAQGRPIVYHVDSGSPAEQAGLTAGMTITRVNDRNVKDVIADKVTRTRKYSGYSSSRYLRYHVGQWLGRQMDRDSMVQLDAIDVDGKQHQFKVKATLGVRYLPRLPVPIKGISDSANISWKRLDDETGYIYVRRIRSDLPDRLDAAVAELKECSGLIIDVRGNSGGGFDAGRAFRNFDLDDINEPERPRFKGPIAVLIDSRCISAGEGWVSWFRSRDRGKFFGETTAGASSRKTTVNVLHGDYKVRFSVKAYRGFLDRPIERIGIEPDVEVHQTAEGLSNQSDAVLNAARQYLSQPGV